MSQPSPYDASVGPLDKPQFTKLMAVELARATLDSRVKFLERQRLELIAMIRDAMLPIANVVAGQDVAMCGGHDHMEILVYWLERAKGLLGEYPDEIPTL